MFLQNLRAKVGARLNGDSEAGFTLIELLVVMLILGILAAIAIPAFFNQKDKATDASAKAMARSAETAMETYAIDHGGVYNGTPAASGTILHEIEPTIEAEKVTISEVGAKQYKVTVESDVEGQTFSIKRNEDGTTTFTCTEFSTGGCPASPGNWGKG